MQGRWQRTRPPHRYYECNFSPLRTVQGELIIVTDFLSLHLWDHFGRRWPCFVLRGCREAHSGVKNASSYNPHNGPSATMVMVNGFPLQSVSGFVTEGGMHWSAPILWMIHVSFLFRSKSFAIIVSTNSNNRKKQGCRHFSAQIKQN